MEEHHCLAQGCRRGRNCRGLCQKHYKAAQRMVRRTELTWEEIARAGLCLPAAQAGRRACSYADRLTKLQARLHPAACLKKGRGV